MKTKPTNAKLGGRLQRLRQLREAGRGGGRVVTMATAGIVKSSKSAMDTYYAAKIEELEVEVRDKMLNLRRLEAQRNELNSKVRLLREELSLLQEPGSYVGEVVKVMGRKKVLVKVRPQQTWVGRGRRPQDYRL